MMPHKLLIPTLLLCSVILTACSSQPQQTGTLGDLDTTGSAGGKPAQAAPQKSKEDIKRAYYDYLKSAAKDDKLRVTAATRIAELELELDQQIHGESVAQTADNDAAFTRAVRNTIELLNTTLRDFPNAAGNDHVMYQLAKAYDQVAESDKALVTLEKMVQLYPHTPYFMEARFRMAEHAFVNGRYFDAEDAYTDVIQAQGNAIFMEKALFKRGWARYKQELYKESLDDYFAAAEKHQFSAYEELSKADQELFDEYFRAVGLAFLYMGGADALKDYFGRHKQRAYVFTSYKAVAELQLKQERYSDAAATYAAFSDEYPQNPDAIHAGLAVIKIWKDAQFFEPYRQAFDEFYRRYEPGSNFWKITKIRVPDADKKLAIGTIRENIVLLAGRDHAQYRKTNNTVDFTAAQRGYELYLKDYAAYARQDKIYQLYAELLNQAGQTQQSLTFYEKAAFDGDIVLDKESAYAAVFVTDKLQQQATDPKTKTQWLDKHLAFAKRYAELYAGEKQTPVILQNATQLAFKAGSLDRVIEFANILPDTAPTQIREEVNLLKAQALFDSQQYEEAELVYQDLLVNPDLSKSGRRDLGNKLALSIYRQAELAQKNKQPEEAARQFLRVHREIPESELAPTAMYDAIALFMNNGMWNESIDYLNRFKQLYPKHPFQADVSKKLSVAYLNSGRSLEAAREFEKLSDFGADAEEKMAALWHAAELYQGKGDLASAARAYTEYAKTYKRPYPQNLEAMGHLATIHGQLADTEKRRFWLREIINTDAKAAKSNKTARTEFLSAGASFDLAELRQQDFDKVRLVNPLPKSLQNKKTAMQDAVKLYGQSAVYGHPEFVTRATLAIGDIYRKFARSLLESERPKGLNADELEQYNILLEDQAFPFEDKAIEFYETNVSRISTGTFDPAIKTSLEQLKTLFPARYGRPGKVETSVGQLTP
jgi:TolA-binding protein